MLKPDVQKTRSFADGARERISFAPMSEEEEELISVEEYAILDYHNNYRRAIKGEASWWEVYSNEEEIDAEIALQERAKSAQKITLKMRLDSDFKNGIILRPRNKDCSFKCERAAFAAKVTTVKVTIEYEE